jgi:ribosomal protein S18 acetylase RimI-like enzyme
VTIQFVDHQESDQLYRLLVQLGYTPDLETLPELLNKLNQSETDYVVAAYEEEKMIGWLHAVIMQRVTAGRFVEIVGLVVSMEDRREGIGRALVENAVKWCTSNGFTRIRVRTQTHREDAHNFYRDLGFELNKEQLVFDKML